METAETYVTKAYSNISLGLRIAFMGDQWTLFRRVNGHYEAIYSDDNRDNVVKKYQELLK